MPTDHRGQPSSIADLVHLQSAGEELAFVFFWGHTSGGGARTGPWCLSQWRPAPFELDGCTFATAEHYMMWRKAELFGDAQVTAAVLATLDPARAKALGRTVAGFSTPRWAEHRFDAVVTANRAKFTSDPELRTYLLGTGSAVLVEASPVDALWGIGLAADHPDAPHPARWPGANLLGFALMQVRAGLGRSTA